jgi:hypothetical protein
MWLLTIRTEFKQLANLLAVLGQEHSADLFALALTSLESDCCARNAPVATDCAITPTMATTLIVSVSRTVVSLMHIRAFHFGVAGSLGVPGFERAYWFRILRVRLEQVVHELSGFF